MTVRSAGGRMGLDDVVATVRAQLDELVEQMVRSNVEQVPELAGLAGDGELGTAIRSSARSNLQAALAALEQSGEPPAELSPGARAEAEQAARSGLPLEALLHTYRIGHAVVLQALLDAIEALALDGPRRRELVRQVNRFGFGYIDGLIPMVRLAYEREREAMLADRDYRRSEAVRRILDGEVADLAVGDHPLAADHVAVVLSAPHEAPSITGLDCEVLTSRDADGRWLAWFSRRRGWLEDGLRELESRLREHGAGGGMGEPGRGVAGFRRSHREAALASRLAAAGTGKLCRYSRVAVEALALQDEERAREFVVRQLGPLSGAKDAGKIQQTLRTYFELGMNAAATAATLGVHPRTVGYRIAVAEQLFEAPLPEIRFQLEAALRLSSILL